MNTGEPLRGAPEDLLNLDEIMQAFGVGVWKNLGALEPETSTNSAYLQLLVDIQGERYILRERPEGLVGEDAHHRYAFQHYLRQAGIPIPALWQTPQGEPTVVIGEDEFELQQWSPGELFNTTSPHTLDWIAAAGTMLGRLHTASRHYTGHTHRWPQEAHIGSILQGYLQLARNKAETSSTQAIAVALTNWVDQWEAVLPSAMMSIGAGKNLPELHIHGDYHAHNLRFDASGVTAVMGLEASRWEKRIFEVAYALFYFSALSWQPGTALTRPLVKRGFMPEHARYFLQAYGALCPPERGEALLLTDALTLISPIATIHGPLEDLFYTSEKPEVAVIDDVLERLAWAASLPAWLKRVRSSIAEMWR